MLKLEDLKTDRNLKDYAEKNLQKSGKLYCCPACGSGTHGSRNSDGALSIDGALWKCFSCGAGGSVIDLIMATEHKDLQDATRRLHELYDPDYDPYRQPPQRAATSNPANPTKTATPKQEGASPMTDRNEQQTKRRDFRNYFKKCRKKIYDTDYCRRRGLDEEIVKRFGLGFDPNWTSPTAAYNWKQENARRQKAGEPPLLPLAPSPRLIIPLSAHNYLARDTRPDDELTEAQKKFKKMNEGKEKPFFNIVAMNNPLGFYVTEGELDAISITQAGGSCVALGSTVKAKAFGELLQKRDPVETGTVIIALDNDPAGQAAAEIIVNACEFAGLDYIRVNASGQYKDPNDFLVHDRKGFYATIQNIIQQVREDKLADYEAGNAANAAKEFMNRPLTAGAMIPTGFDLIDDFLGGGLCAGLVFIGGLSSLGKTTLALQIGEHIAMENHKIIKNEFGEEMELVDPARDVLYFALEQSKEDLLSKILSRRTYLRSLAQNKGEALAKTNIQLLRRNLWQKWPQPEWDNLWTCYCEFKQQAGGTLRIIESPGDITAADIAKITERHIAITGRTPGAVIVDYLQILKPIDDRMTDKQAIDRTITTLKRLSRDHEMTVIGISSFNRENYFQKVSLAAFKDSGNLEYSADILLAIAPAGMEEASGDKDKAKNKETAEQCKESKDKRLQLHVLKNRNGKTTGKKNQLLLKYHSWYNCFVEEKPESYLSHFDNGNPSM